MIHMFVYDGQILQTESDSDWAEIDAIQKYERMKKAKLDKEKKEQEDLIRRIVREEIERAIRRLKE